MLGKLFKHEFKETARLLIPLNLILIAVTLIGAILLGTSVLQNESLTFLSVSLMMLYILSIFALFIITAVYLTIRFYKTMYSNQGYLTHTLPVSTSSIINTKLLTSAFWTFVALLITIGSVFVLVRVTVGEEWNGSRIIDELNVMMSKYGMGLAEFTAVMVFTLIISCFSGILMIFASLAVGQIFHQYRVLAAVGAYVVFYIIQQVIGTVTLIILGIGNIDDVLQEENASNAVSAFYSGTVWSGIIESLVFCIVFYTLCHHITNRRLNLE